MNTFEIIPVVDVQHGLAVRGIAGQRHLYKPLCSPLVTDGDFLALMKVLQSEYAFPRCYIADLDAIVQSGDNLGLVQAYCRQPGTMGLLLDAGLRRAKDAPVLLQSGAEQLVVGSETLSAPEELAALLNTLGERGIMLSVDTMGGRLLCTAPAFAAYSPEEFIHMAGRQGVKDFFLLQLDQVGTGGGLDKELIGRCLAAVGDYGGARLWMGGGVANLGDLAWLKGAGVQGAFIASLLHSGVFKPGTEI